MAVCVSVAVSFWRNFMIFGINVVSVEVALPVTEMILKVVSRKVLPERLALLRIREVPNSHLGAETWLFLLFSTVTPGRCQRSTSVASFHILSNMLFINHLTI
jgi:hypothetical protein